MPDLMYWLVSIDVHQCNVVGKDGLICSFSFNFFSANNSNVVECKLKVAVFGNMQVVFSVCLARHSSKCTEFVLLTENEPIKGYWKWSIVMVSLPTQSLKQSRFLVATWEAYLKTILSHSGMRNIMFSSHMFFCFVFQGQAYALLQPKVIIELCIYFRFFSLKSSFHLIFPVCHV